jgi:hypothetical protein
MGMTESAFTSDDAHPMHGVHRPSVGTPPRARPSVRRTASIDIVGPEGLAGALQLDGRVRDLVTDPDGAAQIAAEGKSETTIAYQSDQSVLYLSVLPHIPGLEQLVGSRVFKGFRASLASVFTDARGAGRSALHQLLDDIPAATLIAGQAQISDRDVPGVPQLPILSRPGVCAGWRSGGTMMTSVSNGQKLPLVHGPAAPDLLAADDPLGWHEMPPGSPTVMRRHRRIDLTWEVDHWLAQSFLRDCHWLGSGPARGAETVIHEYHVEAQISPDYVIRDIVTTARVLPWTVCSPAAERSAELVGMPIMRLSGLIRSNLVGDSSCTHLNDVLRSLEGVPSLARQLHQFDGSRPRIR